MHPKCTKITRKTSTALMGGYTKRHEHLFYTPIIRWPAASTFFSWENIDSFTCNSSIHMTLFRPNYLSKSWLNCWSWVLAYLRIRWSAFAQTRKLLWTEEIIMMRNSSYVFFIMIVLNEKQSASLIGPCRPRFGVIFGVSHLKTAQRRENDI